jgi:hypothetical protein
LNAFSCSFCQILPFILFIFLCPATQKADQKISATAKRRAFAPAPALLTGDRLFATAATPTQQQNPKPNLLPQKSTLFDASRFPAWLSKPIEGVGYVTDVMGELQQSLSSELHNKYVQMQQRSMELENPVSITTSEKVTQRVQSISIFE